MNSQLFLLFQQINSDMYGSNSQTLTTDKQRTSELNNLSQSAKFFIKEKLQNDHVSMLNGLHFSSIVDHSKCSYTRSHFFPVTISHSAFLSLYSVMSYTVFFLPNQWIHESEGGIQGFVQGYCDIWSQKAWNQTANPLTG